MAIQEIDKVFKLVGTGLVVLKICHKLSYFKRLLLINTFEKRNK